MHGAHSLLDVLDTCFWKQQIQFMHNAYMKNYICFADAVWVFELHVEEPCGIIGCKMQFSLYSL